MDNKNIFRWTWVILILVAFSLGCKLVTGVSRMIAVATEVDLEGRATEIDLEALQTQVNLEGLATQMGSLATEFDQGAFETENSAIATQMSKMSTEIGLGDLLTEMPALQGTLTTFATPSGFPADIPLLEGDKTFLGGTDSQLQYAAKTEFNDAVDFYRNEMSAGGWTEGSASRVQDKVASLVFERGDQTVTVSIVDDLFFGVVVSIVIEG